MITVKFGIVKLRVINPEVDIIYKVVIKEEYDEYYIVKYLGQLNYRRDYFIESKPLIVLKDKITSITEKKMSNWSYFWNIYFTSY